MALRLNESAFEYAKTLISEGNFVRDGRDDWGEDQPSAEEENEFIERRGFPEYANWHLGIDAEEPEDTKKRYKFPFGDFVDVHRYAVLAAESRAGQYKYSDIELAAAHLKGMIDETNAMAAG